jgi:hypothetical protein
LKTVLNEVEESEHFVIWIGGRTVSGDVKKAYQLPILSIVEYQSEAKYKRQVDWHFACSQAVEEVLAVSKIFPFVYCSTTTYDGTASHDNLLKDPNTMKLISRK